MAVRSGVGFVVSGVDGHAGLFSEGPSRVVVCAAPSRLGPVRERAAVLASLSSPQDVVVVGPR